MEHRIIEIEGIGPSYAAKLESVGVKTVTDLLEKGKNVKGRKELAKETGISGKRILTWVNHADLLRIDGVDPDCAELLEAAGVDTVTELALRNPVNLEKKMSAVNEAKHLSPKVPSLKEIKEMIAKAKTLPRVISYGKLKPVKVEQSEKTVQDNNTTTPKSDEVKTVNIYEDDDVKIVDFDRYEDGKYGLKDENGNWVAVYTMYNDYDEDEIPLVSKFDDAGKWRGLIMLQEDDYLWGIIDQFGDWIIMGFDGFEDEGYSYLTGWQDGDEWHIYPNGRVVMAYMEEDEEEDWEDEYEED